VGAMLIPLAIVRYAAAAEWLLQVAPAASLLAPQKAPYYGRGALTMQPFRLQLGLNIPIMNVSSPNLTRSRKVRAMRAIHIIGAKAESLVLMTSFCFSFIAQGLKGYGHLLCVHHLSYMQHAGLRQRHTCACEISIGQPSTAFDAIMTCAWRPASPVMSES